MEVKELKRKAQLLEPVVRIGKKGLSEETVEEIKKALKKRKLVKIKILRSAIDKNNNKKSIMQKIGEKTKSTLISEIGNVIVIYKG